MGLVIVPQLVDMMRGIVWVDSVDGEGSTFHFIASFQAADTVEPATSQARAMAGKNTKKLHILVTEDNAVSQKMLIRLLEKKGHSVETLADGKEALVVSPNGQFELILMDVQMPGLDGIELTQMVREQEQTAVHTFP